MKYSYSFTILIFAILVSISFATQASAAETGTTLENLRLRSSASTSSTVITTISKGNTVSILQKQNDWYSVQVNGKTGWMSAEYIKVNAIAPVAQATTSEVKETVNTTGILLFNSRIRQKPVVANNILLTLPEKSRVSILEKTGEWYKVNTELGLQGYIMAELVKVESSSSLGAEPASKTIAVSKSIPESVDVAQMNQYWLDKVNALRAERDLRQLVLDERWNTTAIEWAEYMASLGYATHARSDGKSMHRWIDAKGLDFTKRNSENGWKVNYFTENIAWGITDASNDGVKRVLDNTLQFFLNEGASGVHYRTIYHADWNSVGLGYYFVPQGKGKYKVYIAMHYGSLQLK